MARQTPAEDTQNGQCCDHAMQCMEIIGGNETVQHTLTSPGLDIWVSSRPIDGDAGGDVHYFSMCGSGRVTRMVLADVSGHGRNVSDTAVSLRRLMRKHINLLDQTRFAREVNREFAGSESDHFATALMTTYFAPTHHLIICNGGHPRPIWYSRASRRWQMLDMDAEDLGRPITQESGRYLLKPLSNLPLGVIEPTDYYQFSVKLTAGDFVLVYSDALIEARSRNGELLGEAGLLALVENIETSDTPDLGKAVLQRVDEYRGHTPPEDDQTLIVLHHNGAGPMKITPVQMFKSMTKMLGL